MNYYSLRDVIFFLETHHQSLTEQREKAKKLGVNPVMTNDKADLMSYLNGDSDTCDQIDASKQFTEAVVEDSSKDIEIEEITGPTMPEEEMEMHRQKFSRWLACKRKSPYVLAHMPPEEVVVDESQLDPKYKFYRMDPEYWKADQRKVNAIKNGAIAAKTKVSQLRGVGSDGKPHSFKFALELFNNHVLRYVGKDGKIKEKEMRRGNSSSSTRAPKTTVRGLPIIVVPNILTGCISSYNAMDFLGKDAKWISIADKKKAGGKREKEIKITHEFPNGNIVEFLVMDDPRTLRLEQDWERIVAVFAVGQPWQFKGWANIYSNPVELFQHVCGVHLMLDNDKAMDNIKSWSCKVLKINQFKRHLDVGAANDFWDMLDAFCKKKKTWVYKSSATYSSR